MKIYEKSDVKRLRTNREKLVPKGHTVTTEWYQKRLGKLQAAGHLLIRGEKSVTINKELLSDEWTDTEYTLHFKQHHKKDQGEAPHFTGYLESVHDADKHTYKIHGWLNPNGSIRLELVN